MPNSKQDRSKVAAGQDHELRYEANKIGASKTDVEDAVKSADNGRNKGEDRLAKQ